MRCFAAGKKGPAPGTSLPILLSLSLVLESESLPLHFRLRRENKRRKRRGGGNVFALLFFKFSRSMAAAAPTTAERGHACSRGGHAAPESHFGSQGEFQNHRNRQGVLSGNPFVIAFEKTLRGSDSHSRTVAASSALPARRPVKPGTRAVAPACNLLYEISSLPVVMAILHDPVRDGNKKKC